METFPWLLLTYKVPAEPASKRVALWRRLKSMGAVYLQNGVCLLPETDDHVRRLKMLENDIAEIGGEAVILEAVALDRLQEDKVVASKSIATMPIASSLINATISKRKSQRKRPHGTSLTTSSRKTTSS